MKNNNNITSKTLEVIKSDVNHYLAEITKLNKVIEESNDIIKTSKSRILKYEEKIEELLKLEASLNIEK